MHNTYIPAAFWIALTKALVYVVLLVANRNKNDENNSIFTNYSNQLEIDPTL